MINKYDETKAMDYENGFYLTSSVSRLGNIMAHYELYKKIIGIPGDVVELGGIILDKSAHEVSIDGKKLELSFKEFELLAYFIDNKGIALSREKILNNVWNYDYYGDARTIDTHVKKLRNKMGDKGSYIKTIWGMGYKFEAEQG